MNRKLPLALVGLAAALPLAACASGERSHGNATTEASADRRESVNRSRAIESFPPETQAFMKAGLHQFDKADPQWETTRVQWLAKGPEEADFLVQLMWAGLLKAQDMNAPQLVERARHELYKIGEPAIPLMAEFLAGGTVYSTVDEASGERRDVVVDDFARSEASRVLGLIGAPAVPAVRNAFDRAPSKAGKRYALQTLGYIGDRGGLPAYELLVAEAQGGDEVLRVEAVDSLRYFHDETTRAVLIQALSHADDLVRRKAADALRERREASAVAYLRAAAERARGEAKLVEAGEMERAATSIERHPK